MLINFLPVLQSLGSQLWDAVFATQAIIASNLEDEFGTTLKRAHNFLKQTQVSFRFILLHILQNVGRVSC